ncbi:ATPase [Erythrobacter sp. sf7]|uniref:ATPase n=1 Tax=Erythrobacter fulvus TaxID=2987523 RepID=A0ABT5JLZ3_9SPHN|nr:ATPase [Erythrobacter fulvus]MDC8753390.1 ATPase [Erythrobacter fulvus]
MAGRHQIRALGRKSGADHPAQSPSTQDGDEPGSATANEEMLLREEWEAPALDLPDRASAPSRSGWLPPALALVAIAAWTGFFGWTISSAAIGGAAPTEWAGWIVEWSVPVALIGIVWLLAMRSSRAEANRFAASAALLSRESAELEERLKVVNRELSLAREFLAAQSRDLEALGRIAAERISTHAGELQQLITTNGAQVDAIGTASETALGNMNRLRDDLPVIANAARDVANQIGSAGNNALHQLERLGGGFEKLGELGSSSEVRVQGLASTIGQTLESFETQVERVEALVANRFTALQGEAGAYRERLEELEAAALEELRARTVQLETDLSATAERLRQAEDAARDQMRNELAALEQDMAERLRVVEETEAQALAAARERIAAIAGEADRLEARLAERDLRFSEAIEQRQAAFDTREAQASEVLAQRLAALDDALAQRREAQVADTEKLVAHGESIAAQLEKFGGLLAQVSQQGDAARNSLTTGFDELGEKLSAKRIALGETEARLAQLTESGVRLLEIIQSGARTSREDLQQAIASASESLTAIEGRADEVGQMMLRTSQSGSDLSDYLVKTRSEIDAADEAIAGFRARLAEQSDEALARIQGLRGGFARLANESGTLAGDTQERLREALSALETAIAQAFVTLEEGTREKTTAMAEKLGEEAVQVLERALRNETAATIGKIEQAAAHASGVGREVVIQLRDQLVRVNELTGNLEQRVSRARELAEEQVNNDFARRMALITDSLNSAAIDISGALSTEVADTAWDAYLKGDRGIFTRRAVRLIDNGMAREIVELYQRDDTFKTNVSRYIHDFEAMLRATLSTRDGHVLSVTMLGSDMGKLYVALAQSIQRFRS